MVDNEGKNLETGIIKSTGILCTLPTAVGPMLNPVSPLREQVAEAKQSWSAPVILSTYKKGC